MNTVAETHVICHGMHKASNQRGWRIGADWNPSTAVWPGGPLLPFRNVQYKYKWDMEHRMSKLIAWPSYAVISHRLFPNQSSSYLTSFLPPTRFPPPSLCVPHACCQVMFGKSRALVGCPSVGSPCTGSPDTARTCSALSPLSCHLPHLEKSAMLPPNSLKQLSPHGSENVPSSFQKSCSTSIQPKVTTFRRRSRIHRGPHVDGIRVDLSSCNSRARHEQPDAEQKGTRLISLDQPLEIAVSSTWAGCSLPALLETVCLPIVPQANNLHSASSTPLTSGFRLASANQRT